MSRGRVAGLLLALGFCLLVLPVCSGGGGSGVAAAGCPPTETSASNPRDNRAIAGVSMGGYGALNLGTKHQDTFGVIGSMGGPVDLRQLLRDIRDDNLEVKPQVGPIPENVGDDFTFDLLPPYPDRQTRIGFTKDLVLAFGNPTLHHPDPDAAYLASDSEPAAIGRDDVWGTFTPLADPRGFSDGGDANDDGLRQVGENMPNEPTDALLLAPDTLGVGGGVNIGGRLLADTDMDGIYDIGDGIVVNMNEPFVDDNGNGVFDFRDTFSDVGLDGVAGTMDEGEGNGMFDEDPDIPGKWIPEDPRTRISGMSVENLCSQRIYMDAGDEDELNFLAHHQNVEAAINAVVGAGTVARIQGYGSTDCVTMPSIDAQFSFLIYPGGHVGFDTDQLEDDLTSLDFCDSSISIWQRLIHLLAALNASFPDPVMGFQGTDPGDTTTIPIASQALNPGGGPDPMRTVVIYRPPAHHNTSERLPIVYFLGGHGQDPEDYLQMNALMDTLIFANLVQNMYIAFLPGEGGTEGSFYVNHTVGEDQVPTPPAITVTSGRYEDSIITDLIPHIENVELAGRIR